VPCWNLGNPEAFDIFFIPTGYNQKRHGVRISIRSLHFSVDLVLEAALALGSTQPLTEMRTRNLPGKILWNPMVNYRDHKITSLVPILSQKNLIHTSFHFSEINLNIILPPLWSSGQSSWLQIQRPGFDFRCYQIF
jgi:hypothetical protein